MKTTERKNIAADEQEKKSNSDLLLIFLGIVFKIIIFKIIVYKIIIFLGIVFEILSSTRSSGSSLLL